MDVFMNHVNHVHISSEIKLTLCSLVTLTTTSCFIVSHKLCIPLLMQLKALMVYASLIIKVKREAICQLMYIFFFCLKPFCCRFFSFHNTPLLGQAQEQWNIARVRVLRSKSEVRKNILLAQLHGISLNKKSNKLIKQDLAQRASKKLVCKCV